MQTVDDRQVKVRTGLAAVGIVLGIVTLVAVVAFRPYLWETAKEKQDRKLLEWWEANVFAPARVPIDGTVPNIHEKEDREVRRLFEENNPGLILPWHRQNEMSKESLPK